jgi:hypothetical protein
MAELRVTGARVYRYQKIDEILIAFLLLFQNPYNTCKSTSDKNCTPILKDCVYMEGHNHGLPKLMIGSSTRTRMTWP